MSDSTKMCKSYRLTFRKYGITPRALQWRSMKAAEVRYEEMVKDIDFEGKNILDIGCGFGDILRVIDKKARHYTYIGVDLMPEFIGICRKRYKNHKFIQRDYFSNPLKECFDIVLTSGTLNSNIENALDFRKKAIGIMFKKAKEVVAFNMAGGYPRPENKYKKGSIYYANSLMILKYCLNLTSKLVFRQSYRKTDFTVVMYK